MDFKNLPPCKLVLCKKIERATYLARMIKSSNKNIFDEPRDGWKLNESGELEIDYYTGSPYPETITDLACSEDSQDEEEFELSSSDEDDSDEDFNDDNLQ